MLNLKNKYDEADKKITNFEDKLIQLTQLNVKNELVDNAKK